MRLNCVDVKVKDHLALWALGDIHFGSRECDVNKFEKYLGWAKENKDVRILLMGDLINSGTRASIGAGTYDDEYNPQEQYEIMLDYLKPIKKKIIGAHIGNHETRIRDLSSFDVTKMMCRELKVPYLGYSALTKLRVNKNNYIVYSTHGNTGASTVSGKLNKCMKQQEIADADIYLYGHTHGLTNDLQTVYKANIKNKVLEEKERHFVLTGSFVKWDGSYGEMKNYPLLKTGAPKIDLSGKKWDINVRL